MRIHSEVVYLVRQYRKFLKRLGYAREQAVPGVEVRRSWRITRTRMRSAAFDAGDADRTVCGSRLPLICLEQGASLKEIGDLSVHRDSRSSRVRRPETATEV